MVLNSNKTRRGFDLSIIYDAKNKTLFAAIEQGLMGLS